jgi:hypothetical protein
MEAPRDFWKPFALVAGILLALALLVGFAFGAAAQPRRNPATQASTVKWLADRGTTQEATARPGNDGPAVAAIIRAGGGNPAIHPEWCGFTQAANQRAHGLPIPAKGMQGAARAWFVDAQQRPLSRCFYYAGRRGVLDSVQAGDLLGFAWRPNPVIHHITRAAKQVPPLRRGRPPRGYWSWGGNEGRFPTAGMHYHYYPAANITAAARWDYR